MKIGLEEDNLIEDEVRSYILAVLQPITIQNDEIKKQQTIFDLIAVLTSHLSAGKIDEKSHEQLLKVPDKEKLKSNPVLFHDKTTNNLLYSTIHDKYFECTEQERRSITRSDAEFCMMIRSVITKLSGFVIMNKKHLEI